MPRFLGADVCFLEGLVVGCIQDEGLGEIAGDRPGPFLVYVDSQDRVPQGLQPPCQARSELAQSDDGKILFFAR